MLTQIASFESGDPVFAVDRQGTIVLWNEAAESTFGYTAEAALGRRCWKLLCGYDTYDNQYCRRRCSVRHMAHQHKLINRFKVQYRTANEKRKPFEVSCLAIFDEPGEEFLLHLCRPERRRRSRAAPEAETELTAASIANHPRGPLSPRELEALTLLAGGRNNHEIANAMSISIPTVRNHIQHVLGKLGAHSRLEAVVVGRQLKLL